MYLYLGPEQPSRTYMRSNRPRRTCKSNQTTPPDTQNPNPCMYTCHLQPLFLQLLPRLIKTFDVLKLGQYNPTQTWIVTFFQNTEFFPFSGIGTYVTLGSIYIYIHMIPTRPVLKREYKSNQTHIYNLGNVYVIQTSLHTSLTPCTTVT